MQPEPPQLTPEQIALMNKLASIMRAVVDAVEHVAPGWHLIANPGYLMDEQGHLFSFTMGPQQMVSEVNTITIPMEDHPI